MIDRLAAIVSSAFVVAVVTDIVTHPSGTTAAGNALFGGLSKLVSASLGK